MANPWGNQFAPPEAIPHGTYRGYHMHKRRGQEACGPCLEGKARYVQERRCAGRCAPGLGWPLLPGKAEDRG